MDACLLGDAPIGEDALYRTCKRSSVHITGLKDKSCSWNFWSARLPFDMNPPQLPGSFRIEEISVRAIQIVKFLLFEQSLVYIKRTVFFPQQRKLMGSSAQNRSGVHWCRRRVKFNEVPEKVPEVPEKVWEALVQSQAQSNRVPEKVPEKVWEALVQSQARFNRVPRRFRRRFLRRSGKLWCRARSGSTEFWRRFRRRSGRLWCRARSGSTEFRKGLPRRPERLWPKKVLEKVPGGGQVQRGSEEGSEEGLEGFGAEPSHIQQGSGEGSGGGGRLRCGARSGLTGIRRRFWRRFQEALVRSQVRLNGFGRRLQRRSRCRARSGSNRFNWFPALGFAARFTKIYKNKTLRLLGIPPKLIFSFGYNP